MQDQYVLALDQGTTSSRAVVFDRRGNIVSIAQKEFRQIYPQPGWVEHDPDEIWSTQAGVATEAITHVGLSGSEIAAIGITNQRETTIVWCRETGPPISATSAGSGGLRKKCARRPACRSIRTFPPRRSAGSWTTSKARARRP